MQSEVTLLSPQRTGPGPWKGGVPGLPHTCESKGRLGGRSGEAQALGPSGLERAPGGDGTAAPGASATVLKPQSSENTLLLSQVWCQSLARTDVMLFIIFIPLGMNIPVFHCRLLMCVLTAAIPDFSGSVM